MAEEDASKADNLIEVLKETFAVAVLGAPLAALITAEDAGPDTPPALAWPLEKLEIVHSAVCDLAAALGGAPAFRQCLGGLTVNQKPIRARGLTWKHKITFTSAPVSIDRWTAAHELAHAWDANSGWTLGKELERFTGGRTRPIPAFFTRLRGKWDVEGRLPGCNAAGYYYGGVPPKGSDMNFNRKEDFAEAVTAYLYPEEAQAAVQHYKGHPLYGFLYYEDYRQNSRWGFVQKLVSDREE
jgi:hypothetical protein